MSELSHCGDVRTLDSFILPRGGSTACADAAETELRRLFHQLTSHGDVACELLLGPERVRANHSELFSCWVQRLHDQVTTDGEKREDGTEVIESSDRWLPFCPDLRRRIKKLVRILGAEKSSGAEIPDKLVLKRMSDESLQNVLLSVKCLAADPCGKEGPNQEMLDHIVRARKALFLRAEDISVSDMEEFPYRSRKRRARVCTSVAPGGTESEMPKRRSQRTLDLLKIGDSHLPRMRIPVGSSFQADVPEWTGPQSNTHCSDATVDTDSSRWLGTLVWPVEGFNTLKNERNIGKRRLASRCYCIHPGSVECIKSHVNFERRLASRCYCSHPGSVECIKIHVNFERIQLKSYLGSVFTSWGFDEMGEDVSKSWTREEQVKFGHIVGLNPLSQGKSFLLPALKFFISKRKKDIVSYYFNVYVLRRMSNQTRVLSGIIDSDDDEGNSKPFDFGSYARVPIPEVSYSLSPQSRFLLPGNLKEPNPFI
ncbi:AT-rich interactive domain-containing protein 2 [Platanthera guangdongensis]|uniref:AT-rich interactive domain-containing protein 2 n=1 Tax=Platanthera guangdongensis TaxID=2320717 RepID=A0ABR2N043_9ASPA